MQLFTFCLLVIVGHAVTGAPLSQIQLKLEEIQKDLRTLNKHMLQNSQMLNTPRTEDIKRCCSGHALQCFSEKLSELKTSAAASQRRLIRSLQKTIVQKSVSSCSAEELENVACQACDSYPLRDSREFVHALQTLLQRSRDGQ